MPRSNDGRYATRFCWSGRNWSPITLDNLHEIDVCNWSTDFGYWPTTTNTSSQMRFDAPAENVESIVGRFGPIGNSNYWGPEGTPEVLRFAVVDTNDGEIVWFHNGTEVILPLPSERPTEVTPPRERIEMIKLRVVREGGRLMLSVDAKEFHDTLDSIGAQHDGIYYKDRPAAAQTVCNTATHTMSSEILLRRDSYPQKVDLTTVYREPPSITNLKKLCASGYEVARKILEHYQPIDISIEIQKKILK